MMKKVLEDANFIISGIEGGRNRVRFTIVEDTPKPVLIQRFETLDDVLFSSGYHSQYDIKKRGVKILVDVYATTMNPEVKRELLGENLTPEENPNNV